MAMLKTTQTGRCFKIQQPAHCWIISHLPIRQEEDRVGGWWVVKRRGAGWGGQHGLTASILGRAGHFEHKCMTPPPPPPPVLLKYLQTVSE